MTLSIIAGLFAPFALHASTPAISKPTSFADLQIEEATAPRCGIAFAIVHGWQAAGDARGGDWPGMEEAGAREFFLNAMARLIDTYSLERADVVRLVETEKNRLSATDFAAVEAMMPACLILLEASSGQRRSQN